MVQSDYKAEVEKVMDALAEPNEKPTHLNVRYIPRETLHHLKLMAAIERTSVKELVLSLIERKIKELEGLGHRIR